MAKSLKFFFSRLKKKKQLKEALGIDLNELQTAIEQQIASFLDVDTFTTIYCDLGGVNNLGMFIHRANKSCLAITKTQKTHDAQREHRFQLWQYNHVNNALSAKPYCVFVIPDTDYSWSSSEYLTESKAYSDHEIHRLFSKFNVGLTELAKLALSGNAQSLTTELNPNTRIKTVLVNIVSQFKWQSLPKIEQYFKEREPLFSGYESQYQSILALSALIFERYFDADLAALCGLVHGDFKKQNIMKTEMGQLKVIDLQYYTYGVRLWDLAFFYSKDKRGFSDIHEALLPLYSFESIEKVIFTFLYIIASMLRIKPKSQKYTLEYQVKPALLCLDSLLRGS